MQIICCAQNKKITDSIPRPQIEKFIGTWKWTSDSAELIICLKKVTAIIKPDKIRENMIMGVHSFKKSGAILEDHLKDSSLLNGTTAGTILLMAKYDGTNPDEVDGSIKDSLKNKTDYLSLVYNHTAVPSVTLYLNNMPTQRKGHLPTTVLHFHRTLCWLNNKNADLTEAITTNLRSYIF